ncbi:MAG TPA: sigma-70 family RNA polymerase sigma factor [Solirubrobacteraceae bacterium]|nr:sigma-70 family RNA polymerase sigma factor [Solirubrobacteraceae bacterium]
MEASAVHAPAGLARLPLGTPLLRLRSDEQLLALFRAGSDDAFAVIHDRYRQRLFAYVRQMLCAGPRQDAEDVLQDVFVRAYGALRADRREVHLRAWLYRVAHNRCIDHLRRPVPPAVDVFEVSRKPLHDPIEEAQRRADLSQLVEDVGRLPEQQRSALLMREIDGMAYADLAAALDVTVPAVKSLLVRARIGLVEAAEARDADCAEIRTDLMDSYDRGVKASGRARRHMRTCDGCREYRTALRGIRSSFAALSPVATGPLAMAAAKLLGFGGAGGGVAAGGSAAAGGGAATVATVSACKVAAVVCTAALATGGAVEVRQLTRDDRDAPARAAAAKAAAPAAQAPSRPFPAPASDYAPKVADRPPAHLEERRATRRRAAARERDKGITAPPPAAVPPVVKEQAPPVAAEPEVSGGAVAPPAAGEEPAEPVGSAPPPATAPAQPAPAEPTAPAPPAEPGTGTPPTEH